MITNFRTKFGALGTSLIEICWVVYKDLYWPEEMAGWGKVDDPRC